MRSATAMASASFVAVPLGVCKSCSRSSMAEKSFRSSAISIERGEVPMIGTPASSSPFARFSGVCPPNCTITPHGFSWSQMFSTSSSVSGSK